MGVPAHDERDKAFAKLFGIKSVDVIEGVLLIIFYGLLTHQKLF